MEKEDKTVFISYRRTNFGWAQAVYQDLTLHGYDVFFDFKGIASGDFEQVILANIKARAHFVVLLTPSAMERCDIHNDWLRREIETALDTRRNIVPITLDGFDFSEPTIAAKLTGKLATLKRYNALSVPMEYFDAAMARLRERYLAVSLKGVIHPPSGAAKRAADTQQIAANAAQQVSRKTLGATKWFERGIKAVDPSERIRFFSKAIRLNPNHANSYNNRGVARLNNGNEDGALQDYNKAIRLDNKCAAAYVNRGNFRHIKGDIEGALQDYDKAIELDPADDKAYYNRGYLRDCQNDTLLALVDYDKAIEVNPSNDGARQNHERLMKEGFSRRMNKMFSRQLKMPPTIGLKKP